MFLTVTVNGLERPLLWASNHQLRDHIERFQELSSRAPRRDLLVSTTPEDMPQKDAILSATFLAAGFMLVIIGATFPLTLVPGIILVAFGGCTLLFRTYTYPEKPKSYEQLQRELSDLVDEGVRSGDLVDLSIIELLGKDKGLRRIAAQNATIFNELIDLTELRTIQCHFYDPSNIQYRVAIRASRDRAAAQIRTWLESNKPTTV